MSGIKTNLKALALSHPKVTGLAVKGFNSVNIYNKFRLGKRKHFIL